MKLAEKVTRIVFVGAVDFSAHCLKELLLLKAPIVGVVLLANSKSNRHSDYVDLRPLVKESGIPLVEVEDINAPESYEAIKALSPDFLFVFGWSQLIGPKLLKLPRFGCIGTHPAMLPRFRGRHPLVWALVEGRTEAGLTFFFLDEGADSGDILWQKPFSILISDDAARLYEKMKQTATTGIRAFLPLLLSGSYSRIPQNHQLASYSRKRTEADGEIHWELSSMMIYNLIRGLTRPYVGAHTYFNQHRIIVWKADLSSTALGPADQKFVPGTILSVSSDSIVIRTGDGILILKDVDLNLSVRPHQGDRWGSL